MRQLISFIIYLLLASFLILNYQELLASVPFEISESPAGVLCLLVMFYWGWITPVFSIKDRLGIGRLALLKLSGFNVLCALIPIVFPIYLLRSIYPYSYCFIFSALLFLSLFVFTVRIIENAFKDYYYLIITSISVLPVLMMWFLREMFLAQTGKIYSGDSQFDLISPLSFYLQENVVSIASLLVLVIIGFIFAGQEKVTAEGSPQ